MHIVRTIIWVMILFGMLTFSFFNWNTVEVNLWENLVIETKIPVLVIIAFALGLVPMWLYHRSVKWSLDRRIRSLEASIKSAALAHRHEPSVSGSVAAPVDKLADKPVGNPAQTSAKAEDSLSPTQNTAPSPAAPETGDTPV